MFLWWFILFLCPDIIIKKKKEDWGRETCRTNCYRGRNHKENLLKLLLMYADCTKIMLVKPVGFSLVSKQEKKKLLSWFCDCIQEVLINYANCAVKMAVAPCLNIKYQYKWRVVVHWLWRMLHHWLFIWGIFISFCSFPNMLAVEKMWSYKIWPLDGATGLLMAALIICCSFKPLCDEWLTAPLSSAMSPANIEVSLTCHLIVQMLLLKENNVF